jgi:hypothetical protein
LTLLHTLDLAKDNLADSEEVQELCRSWMSLRPEIIKLIDKYSQKRGIYPYTKNEGGSYGTKGSFSVYS